MTNERHGWALRVTAPLAVLLVVAGAAALVIGWRAQRHPPQPPPSAAIAQPVVPPTNSLSTGPSAGGTTGSSTTERPGTVSTGPVLVRSIPLSIAIPDIGVSSNLLQLGINPDHTVQVPPLSRNSQAGWYRYSPTPGQLGPSVILGHVDSAEYGPGVFFKLGALRPGNLVDVTRSDHTVGVFRIERVVAYPKNHFPTLEVYGNTDHAALRLITCGGTFDFSTRSYQSNIVAYASLASSHRA